MKKYEITKYKKPYGAIHLKKHIIQLNINLNYMVFQFYN